MHEPQPTHTTGWESPADAESSQPVVAQAQVLVDGSGAGNVRATDEPISFWGGFDPATGTVIDHRHPLHGQVLTGTVFVVPHGKGSSTGSPVLLDALMQDTAPSAILLQRVDEIIALGGVVAEEFFDRTIPILVLDRSTFEQALIASFIRVDRGGNIRIWQEDAHD